MRKGILNPNNYWIVALDGETIAGTALMSNNCEIHLCYLLPEYLGRGFGKAMLNEIMDYARASGLKKVMLESTRTARVFYLRNGFVETGTIMGLGLIPCFTMEHHSVSMVDNTNMPPGIRAVLFDIDGTLLDTFDYIYGAFEHTFDAHGIARLSRKEISQLMGRTLEDVYATMAPGCDAIALAETHRKYQEQNVTLAKLFPNTVMVLEALKQRGFKLATITTRSNRTSLLSLEQNGIAELFRCRGVVEDVVRHKPDPEPLLKALNVLGVDTASAMMVGDTSADVMAGKNAGTKTVAALYGFGGERLRDLQPDYAIDDLKELLTII